MSAFSLLVATPRAIDLTTGPLAQPPGRWIHPTDYAETQALGAAAHTARLAAIRAPSARQPGGINVAALDATALVPPPGRIRAGRFSPRKAACSQGAR